MLFFFFASLLSLSGKMSSQCWSSFLHRTLPSSHWRSSPWPPLQIENSKPKTHRSQKKKKIKRADGCRAMASSDTTAQLKMPMTPTEGEQIRSRHHGASNQVGGAKRERETRPRTSRHAPLRPSTVEGRCRACEPPPPLGLHRYDRPLHPPPRKLQLRELRIVRDAVVPP